MYLHVYLIQSKARQTGSTHAASCWAFYSASCWASCSALRFHLAMLLLAIFREQGQMRQEGGAAHPCLAVALGLGGEHELLLVFLCLAVAPVPEPVFWKATGAVLPPFGSAHCLANLPSMKIIGISITIIKVL